MSIEELYQLYLQYPSVCIDTRNISQGCIFFALKGENFNANEFAESAINSGAAYAVIDEERFENNEKFIAVGNVLATLQELALYHRRQLKIPFIGITGSNGKTTTKELIHAVLSAKYKTYSTKGNLNNHIGVPLTLLSIKNDAQIAVIEMGANHQKEIEMLCNLCEPDYGMISNVGKAHLEGFGGFEGVKKGKKELYDHLHLHGATVFVNADDEILMEMCAAIEKKVLYGSNGFFEVTGKTTACEPYLSAEISISGRAEKFSINTHLTGDYNINNILAAVCIANYFDVPAEDIVTAIENYIPSNNRSQVITAGSNKIILDAYNANPSSMQAAIRNFMNLKDPNKYLILGDMFELGSESNEEHGNVIMLLKELKAENAMLTGKDFFKHKEREYCYFENSDDLKEFLLNNPIKNSTILIKGSRGMKLESVLELIS